MNRDSKNIQNSAVLITLITPMLDNLKLYCMNLIRFELDRPPYPGRQHFLEYINEVFKYVEVIIKNHTNNMACELALTDLVVRETNVFTTEH
jgi:hypothetical protein